MMTSTRGVLRISTSPNRGEERDPRAEQQQQHDPSERNLVKFAVTSQAQCRPGDKDRQTDKKEPDGCWLFPLGHEPAGDPGRAYVINLVVFLME
jgi:hypothetical protein